MHATSSIYVYTSAGTPTCEVPSNCVVQISLLPVCTGDTFYFFVFYYYNKLQYNAINYNIMQ